MRDLNQTESDLQSFAYEKLGNLISDVSQSFDIAGLDKRNSLVCVASVCLRTSAMIAVVSGLSKEQFLAHCANVHDLCKAEDERKDAKERGV